MNRIEVEKTFDGKWTVRVNAHFIADFWFESRARRLAMKLQDALK